MTAQIRLDEAIAAVRQHIYPTHLGLDAEMESANSAILAAINSLESLRPAPVVDASRVPTPQQAVGANEPPEPRRPWPDPTAAMLETDAFERVWQCIKRWDINVPDVYGGYMGATGNHVRAILDAIRAASPTPEAGSPAEDERQVPRHGAQFTANDYRRALADLIHGGERALVVALLVQAMFEQAAEMAERLEDETRKG